MRGFKDFWRDQIKARQSDSEVRQWLQNLGYDEDLYSIRSRVFILTMHSEAELSVTVRDAIQTDLDNKTNELILQKYGHELENKAEFKTIYTFSE